MRVPPPPRRLPHRCFYCGAPILGGRTCGGICARLWRIEWAEMSGIYSRG